MQAAFDYAVEYVHDRKQFGQPVGEFQLMQGSFITLTSYLCSSSTQHCTVEKFSVRFNPLVS